MNPIEENVPGSDDHRFDLLADGELSESERRELLSRLDEEPGGWRRCALAFLQAQCWRQELGSIARQPDAQPPVKRHTRRPMLSGRGGTLLAMAASFLIALFLGLWLRQMWHRSGPAEAPRMQLADGRREAEEPAPKPEKPEAAPAEAPQPPDLSPGPWRMVSGSEPFQLQATERDTIDDQWLKSFPAPMSDEVLEAAKRAGLEVHQRRELLPFRTRDGRRLVVPVDKVDIHYVGNPAL